MIDPASPYLSYVAASYGVCVLVLGGAAWRAWRGWRRVRDAWARLERRDER
jgi:heme exporter protein CcmD